LFLGLLAARLVEEVQVVLLFGVFIHLLRDYIYILCSFVLDVKVVVMHVFSVLTVPGREDRGR
jgi:hypothetical protein